MSRIRSVHPGFFRDEDLVACSAFARLLYIGLAVESDDKGIFEWKPVQLKMTVFPADSVDVSELLAELVAAGNVKRFEVGGKAYGAIRNFRKYQRPKTPNNIHPMPDDIAQYVAFPQKGETSDAEQSSFPTNGEKSAQMEDVGGRVEDGVTTPPSAQDPDAGARIFDEVWRAFPQHPSSSRVRAQRAWSLITVSEQADVHEAAKRYAGNFQIDCAARKRPPEEGRRYVPPLSKWLESGEWRDALALKVPGMTDSEVVVIDASGPDFDALVRFRNGKRPYVGDTGRITVRKSELEQARAQKDAA